MLLIAVALAIMVLGIFLILKPEIVARKLTTFYKNYPLIRYAGVRQLQTRTAFIVALGIVFVITGLLGLLSTLRLF